jgi:transcriptional regulator with XRE-family HTH domain
MAAVTQDMPKPPPQTIFDRLNVLADACGMSLRELCSACGLNYTHVYRFRHPGPAPSARTLQKLTEKTGVEPHWIVTGTGEMWLAGLPSGGKYPNRARAIVYARDMQLSKASIDVALRLEPPVDRSLAWWIERITAAETSAERKGGS